MVTGSSNAVNLTDGLDGLAAGSLLMVAACLAFVAFVSNHIELANYLNILYIEGDSGCGGGGHLGSVSRFFKSVSGFPGKTNT